MLEQNHVIIFLCYVKIFIKYKSFNLKKQITCFRSFKCIGEENPTESQQKSTNFETLLFFAVEFISLFFVMHCSNGFGLVLLPRNHSDRVNIRLV